LLPKKFSLLKSSPKGATGPLIKSFSRGEEIEVVAGKSLPFNALSPRSERVDAINESERKNPKKVH
jgi:hypothetical protein